MADPLLLKQAIRTVVTPEVPAAPGVAAVAFRMYACPLPQGYIYKQFQSTPGGPYLPNSLATFIHWSQLALAPTEYRSEIAGYTFVAIEDIAPGTPIESNWVPVTTVVEGSSVLTGYLVPNLATVALPPQFYGPIREMEFIRFPEHDVESNGYPIGSGVFNGEYTVPTLEGLLTVRNTYVKDSRGVLLPTGGDPVPPYCLRTGTCKVTAMSGFPGRPAVAAIPAVVRVDRQIGWNSGANSLDTFTADARTVFQVQAVAGVAVGFASPPRTDVTDPNNLSHAFFIRQAGEGLVVFCAEFGTRVTHLIPYAPSMEFTIERVDGLVTYKIDGDTIFVSRSRSSGPVLVGTALYCADDGVF